MKALFDNVNKGFDSAEKYMNLACKIMSRELGVEVIAIRDYGIHLSECADVFKFEDAHWVLRDDDYYHWEAHAKLDGILVFALTTDEGFIRTKKKLEEAEKCSA